MKKETIEEAAKKNCESITHPYCNREKEMFIKGAKSDAARDYWYNQFRKSHYSEEEVLTMLLIKHDGLTPEYVLEQFKNK